ncbi:MAG: L,D-transpeptidase family protein [Desulfobacteraceae bacterium]|nr:L,D-transpeptidase family protein [Desulfobacteraceae bacterium]
MQNYHKYGNRPFILFLVTLICLVLPACNTVAGILTEKLNAELKKRIELEMFRQGLVCQGELICGTSLIPDYYIHREYKPVWVNDTGLSADAAMLVTSLESSTDDGLRAEDYHLTRIEQLINELRQIHDQGEIDTAEAVSMWIDLEVLFTDALLLYGSHLLGGRVNPETLHPDWILAGDSIDLMNILRTVVLSGPSITIFDRVRPPHGGYTGLTALLSEYHRIAVDGGWPVVAMGPSLRKDEQDPRISQLRRRLTISGDLMNSGESLQPDVFDETLESAVIRFQGRHGLNADGIAGEKTLSALNLSVEDRIRQIELNLERWRWLPHDLGERYILVNTADFRLKVVENNHTTLDMRVVVGKPARQTPVFSSRLSYMVVNPYWTVPTTIAVNDILPKIKKDPEYLTKNRFRVFDGWQQDAQELTPELVDWTTLGKRYFPLRFRQDPGAMNALGRIKFMFPNKFAVYLHDTPHRTLFNETIRGFSSGCIRTEKPLDLAAYLMSGNAGWTREKLAEAIEKGSQRNIHLPAPILIHLLYMTAWIAEDGIPQFRDDIYGRDRLLEKALRQRVTRSPFSPRSNPDDPSFELQGVFPQRQKVGGAAVE